METPTERLKNLIAEMTIKSGAENISYNYFGYIFSRIRRIADESIPSIMGIAPRKDGTLALLFNPKYFLGTTNEIMKKVIEHEGMHVLNKHIPRLLRLLSNEPNERVKSAKIGIFNIAADCAVNPIIDFPKEPIIANKPFTPCFPELYGFKDGQPLEHYYFKMLDQIKEQQKKCFNCKKGQGESDDDNDKPEPGGKGQPEDKPKDSKKSADSGDQSDDFSGNGTPSDQGGYSPCDSCPGKGLAGAGQDYDIIGDHSSWSDVASEVSDVSSLSRKIDSHIRDIIKDSVKNFKHRRGSLPSHIQELINSALEPPKIPYYQLIRKLIKGSRVSKFRRSLTKINRKRTYAFIIDEDENIPVISPFPGKTRDFTFNIVILIDTSGSMSVDDVKEGLSGCKNIIEKDRHCKVTVLENDAELQKEYVLKRVSDIDFKIKGRGGTVLRPGIERAREINPDVMLCFTDGGCDNINEFSRKELPRKIIWVVTKDGTTRQIDKTGFIVRID